MPRAANSIDARNELPPAETIRWSFLRKAAVIRGIRAGTISRQHACNLYKLSPEELSEWEKAFDRGHGPYGLLITKNRIKDRANPTHQNEID
jgi:Protein of unknown function (DUF1153)